MLRFINLTPKTILMIAVTVAFIFCGIDLLVSRRAKNNPPSQAPSTLAPSVGQILTDRPSVGQILTVDWDGKPVWTYPKKATLGPQKSSNFTITVMNKDQTTNMVMTVPLTSTNESIVKVEFSL
jgi:hypothetical protein